MVYFNSMIVKEWDPCCSCISPWSFGLLKPTMEWDGLCMLVLPVTSLRPSNAASAREDRTATMSPRIPSTFRLLHTLGMPRIDAIRGCIATHPGYATH